MIPLQSRRVIPESLNLAELEIETERKRSCFRPNIRRCRAKTSGHYCCYWGQVTRSDLAYTHIARLPSSVSVPGCNLQPHVQRPASWITFRHHPYVSQYRQNSICSFFIFSFLVATTPLWKSDSAGNSTMWKSTADWRNFKHSQGSLAVLRLLALCCNWCKSPAMVPTVYSARNQVCAGTIKLVPRTQRQRVWDNPGTAGKCIMKWLQFEFNGCKVWYSCCCGRSLKLWHLIYSSVFGLYPLSISWLLTLLSIILQLHPWQSFCYLPCDIEQWW